MNKERIASLLASGLSPAQVATIVGCSPGRISQLQKEEDFILLLADKAAKAEEQDIEEAAITAKYTATEHALLNQMTIAMQGAELRDLTGALKVIAERQESMKARTLGTKAIPQVQQNTVVSIALPSHALPAPAIEVNSRKEVLSVGAQTLAPLPSKAVEALFNKLRSRNKKTEETGDYHEPKTITGSSEESRQGAVQSEKDFFLEGSLIYDSDSSGS